jgi:hypothetical protein
MGNWSWNSGGPDIGRDLPLPSSSLLRLSLSRIWILSPRLPSLLLRRLPPLRIWILPAALELSSLLPPSSLWPLPWPSRSLVRGIGTRSRSGRSPSNSSRTYPQVRDSGCMDLGPSIRLPNHGSLWSAAVGSELDANARRSPGHRHLATLGNVGVDSLAVFCGFPRY